MRVFRNVTALLGLATLNSLRVLRWVKRNAMLMISIVTLVFVVLTFFYTVMRDRPRVSVFQTDDQQRLGTWVREMASGNLEVVVGFSVRNERSEPLVIDAVTLNGTTASGEAHPSTVYSRPAPYVVPAFSMEECGEVFKLEAGPDLSEPPVFFHLVIGADGKSVGDADVPVTDIRKRRKNRTGK